MNTDGPASTEHLHDAQVLIVGGGAVGLGLAIELGQRGIETMVLDLRDQPQRVPKGQNLTQRTMEHFHAWGAQQELRQAQPFPAEQGSGAITAYGTLTSGMQHDWLCCVVEPPCSRAGGPKPNFAAR